MAQDRLPLLTTYHFLEAISYIFFRLKDSGILSRTLQNFYLTTVKDVGLS